MNPVGMNLDEARIDGSLTNLRNDLARYNALGFQAVEIPVHALDVILWGILDESRLRQVRDILAEFPFMYSVHAPHRLNLMDTDDFMLHTEVLDCCLAFTRAIGSRILVYHPGRYQTEEAFLAIGKREMHDDDRSRMLETEAAAITRAADAYPDVELCMENARPYRHHSPYCYAERVDLLADQIVRIGRANVRVNLDIGHLNMSARYYDFDAVAAAHAIGPLVSHTHIHDNFGGAVYVTEKSQCQQLPFGRGDSHMPVGAGCIPIRDILASFSRSYKGMYMMELRGRYADRLGDSLSALNDILATLPAKDGSASFPTNEAEEIKIIRGELR
jgi:sugar phosphate isomerase/epimerase